MIEYVKIDGYKCLEDSTINCSNLTVLVGPNASGKSSVLQCQLLLRQSADKAGMINELHLSGPLYEAGTAQDALHPASEHRIKIELKADDGVTKFSFRHDRNDESAAPKRILVAEPPTTLPRILHSKDRGFCYLNAERTGPRVSYPLPPDESHLSGLVGKHGEYTAAILARAANGVQIDGWNDGLADLLSAPAAQLDGIEFHEDMKNTSGRLDLVCNQLLGWVIPGAVFQTAENDLADAATLRFVRDPLNTKTSVRATHVGFGLAYTLPIITAALALRQNGLLLVENPEAHLHPFSQSRMGVFLGMVAATGRQIFVETHSDHVINGIRLAVRHGFLKPEDTRINVFSRTLGVDTASITSVEVNDMGRLTPWPDGFFDQIENDLTKL